MLILLPPSEGKSAPARGRPLDLARLSFPDLNPARAKVLDAVTEFCATSDPHDAARLLGVGATLLAEVTRNASLRDSPAARADRVYTGVLYQSLEVASLDAAARRRATRWVAVASGLLGVVRLDDVIPAYRLSGGVTLPGVGNVAGFWREHLDRPVRAAAGRGLVVDLRSSTYAGFWRPGPGLAERVVTVRVLHEVDGRLGVVSHFNKAAKGRLARALLEDGGAPRSPAELAAHLTALGWDVRLGATGRSGTRLDVVVQTL